MGIHDNKCYKVWTGRRRRSLKYSSVLIMLLREIHYTDSTVLCEDILKHYCLSSVLSKIILKCSKMISWFFLRANLLFCLLALIDN